VQAQYLAAWDVMVARYKDKPGVLGFEPINEPGWGTADEATFSATTLTSFYSVVVARMRATAPKSLVFVDTAALDVATLTTQLGRPAGDGVVFAPHFYPLNMSPAMVKAGLQKWVDVGAAWNVPVFVGEFGISNAKSGALAYITANFAAFDALGLSGSEWEYSVSSQNWNVETFSLIAPDGTEYPVAKAVQRPFARAVAGSTVKQAYDPASHTFSLGFVASAGVTEVSLPARVYPSGFQLTVTGACADVSSTPGRLLLRPDSAGGAVSVRIAPK
jgi:endoglycosylceramidase